VFLQSQPHWTTARNAGDRDLNRDVTVGPGLEPGRKKISFSCPDLTDFFKIAARLFPLEILDSDRDKNHRHRESRRAFRG